jgi:hypothetical protein
MRNKNLCSKYTYMFNNSYMHNILTVKYRDTNRLDILFLHTLDINYSLHYFFAYFRYELFFAFDFVMIGLHGKELYKNFLLIYL